MENFVYHNPVKIIFGIDVIDQLGDELTLLGNRILFVYGQKAIKDIGLYDLIIKNLEDAAISYAEFGDVQPNPLLSHVCKGIEVAREFNCDAVLAVGGGSVIDTAKAIAVGVKVKHDVWKFFNGRKSIPATLPLLSLPTIAGSGSEVNHAMALTNDVQALKFGFAHRYLYPQVCIADPTLSFSVPDKLVGSGAVDAFCHCFEPYLTTQAGGVGFQKRFLENSAKTIVESACGCIKNPSSYEHRAAMLWGSMMAMSSIGSAGLGKIYFSLHALEHGLSVTSDIPHGAGLSALLPGWLNYHKGVFVERIGTWGEHVFSVKGSNATEKVESTIAEIGQFLKSMGCPLSLSETGLDSEDLGKIAANVGEQARVWRLPGFDKQTVAEILEYCS